MHEVRIFDGKGKLKQIISVKDLTARADEMLNLSKNLVNASIPKFKEYICAGCKVTFESNARQGAKYCPKCRLNANKRWKERNKKI